MGVGGDTFTLGWLNHAPWNKYHHLDDERPCQREWRFKTFLAYYYYYHTILILGQQNNSSKSINKFWPFVIRSRGAGLCRSSSTPRRHPCVSWFTLNVVDILTNYRCQPGVICLFDNNIAIGPIDQRPAPTPSHPTLSPRSQSHPAGLPASLAPRPDLFLGNFAITTRSEGWFRWSAVLAQH